MKVFAKAGLGLGILLLFPCLLVAQEGFLRVTSDPPGAEVWIDGESKGNAPLLEVLEPGERAVGATLEGYRPVSRWATVKNEEMTLVHFELQPVEAPAAPGTAPGGGASVIVTTERPGASVFLDGERVRGATPLTIAGLAPGRYSLIIVRGNRAAHAEVLVEGTEEIAVYRSLEEDRRGRRPGPPRRPGPEPDEAALAARRSALPARVALVIDDLGAEEGAEKPLALLWSEGESIELIFRYRRPGEQPWQVAEKKSTEPGKKIFELEKGPWEFSFSAVHYRETRGLIGVLTRARKEKLAEYSHETTWDASPDTQYTLTVGLDGDRKLAHRVKTDALNSIVD